MADYTHALELHQFNPTDRRLGRHVAHDSRSLRFRAPAKDPRKLTSVRHSFLIPVLDQGQLGSCTGYAGLNTLATPPFWKATEQPITAAGDPGRFAVGLYSDATRVDPWPGEWEPNDTGSDGLSVAKVLHARGLISGYQHATSLEAALAGLAERVVMIGTTWLSGMFNPTPEGQLLLTGDASGGHEYVLDELDVSRRRAWMRNSWGPNWGLKGRAWLSWEDLGKLLADRGDCTILMPKSEPAPVPTPEPVPPSADVNAELARSLSQFIHRSSCPKYLREDAVAWLKTQPGVIS
jgi:hypothetical protein